jgi:hypothetical protein
MKNIKLVLLFLIISTSSFAACPNNPITLARFLDQLVIKGEYTGDRVEIVSRAGSRPTSSLFTAIYSFTRSRNVITVTSRSCSTDGQCQSLGEETWRYSPLNRCLYVDGNLAQVTKVGINDLRFQFTTRFDKTVRANYRLSSPKSLLINNTSDEPGLFQYVWFNGH